MRGIDVHFPSRGLAAAVALAAGLAGACTGPGPGDDDAADDDTTGAADDDTGGGDDDTSPGEPGLVLLDDANNYHYTGAIDVPSVPVAELTDVDITWADLTLDLQCHPVDPVADIDNLALLVFPELTEAEVEEGLAQGTFDQVDLGGYVSLEPGDATSARLSELTFFGTDVDIELMFAEGSGSWLLLLSTGTQVGVGARTLMLLDPRAGESDTSAEFVDDCDMLDFDADLEELEPLRVTGPGPHTVDWGALTVDAQGIPLADGDIDGVMLARYEGLSPADLESSFLDLELLADDLYTLSLEMGHTASLADLVSVDGPFDGFTEPGTWLLGLRCSQCPNPAPLFLTVVDASGAMK